MAGIRDALVVGAGAVGSAVASIIQDREPGAVSVLAGPGRLERYRARGFVINGKRYDFPLSPVGEKVERDLVIVAVKCHQLAKAIEDMGSQVGEGTIVLSLLNGITSEEELAAAFGGERVMPHAMVLGIDAMRDGNSTDFAFTGAIHFGEARNPPGLWSGRASRVAAFFERVGLPYRVPENMVRTIWYKYMINVGVNQASAILRATYGSFQALPEARRVMEAAMREVVALSAAMGTGLVPEDIGTWYETLMRAGPGAKTSMLQDVEARRKTEVEAFAGTVVELGRRHGVPTPVNELFLDMLRAIERGYLGA